MEEMEDVLIKLILKGHLEVDFLCFFLMFFLYGISTKIPPLLRLSIGTEETKYINKSNYTGKHIYNNRYGSSLLYTLIKT